MSQPMKNHQQQQKHHYVQPIRNPNSRGRMNKNRKMENTSNTNVTKTDVIPAAIPQESSKILKTPPSKTCTEISSNCKSGTSSSSSTTTTSTTTLLSSAASKQSMNKQSVMIAGRSADTILSPSKLTMATPVTRRITSTTAFTSTVTSKTTITAPAAAAAATITPPTTTVTCTTTSSVITTKVIDPTTIAVGTSVSPPTGRSNKRSRRRTRARNQFQIDRIEEINSIEDKLNEDVLSALRSCDEGQELHALSYALTPNPHFLHDISSRVVYDLNYIFGRQFRYFKIFRFGSSMNFLALKNSDFDFYVKIDDMSPEAINGCVSRIIINTMREMQMQCTFTNIVPIFNAKIPLVKCVHKLTGFQCDINFTNSMGVYNTKIIKYFMQYDERIHPLTLILKYWLRTHKLTEICKITNYCLIMLIFFYLQLLNEPILPPICIFQRGVPEISIGYWNVAFDFNFQPIMTRNRSSVMQLLLGFFQYYGNFPFEKLMICPLYARSYDRESFCARIPLELKRYEDFIRQYPRSRLNQQSSICVQDPFDYSHNVAVRCDNLMVFRNELLYAGEICKNAQNLCFTIAPVLIDLFNKRCPPSTPHVVTKQDNLYLTFTPQMSELTLIRQILALKMNGRNNNNSNNNNNNKHGQQRNKQIETIDVHRFWCERYHEFLINIIQDIFQFIITNCKTFDGIAVDDIAEEPINDTNKSETIDEHSLIFKMIKKMKNSNVIDNSSIDNPLNPLNDDTTVNNRNDEKLLQDNGGNDEDAEVDDADGDDDDDCDGDDNGNGNDDNNNESSLNIDDDCPNINEDDTSCANDLIRCAMCVHGIQDVFYLRDYRKPTDQDYENNYYLDKEIRISRLNFDKKVRILNLHCRLFILTSKDYSTLSVLFIDKLLRKRNNGIRYFYNLFSSRIQYYLKAYFCNLERQYANKSVTNKSVHNKNNNNNNNKV